ncbi:hypothetical protein D9758_010962 [Tetrapyrgos nigripes]|uniref:Xylanolytic transcriptional activator regulatory domain-containing protein n=1 Tax=Tetrapyrgos nigripes TaxID=182062 RepID=A0A8H5LPV5_9AGAR|nr:hypothetical protein D9758_010962 [Tetrapyrgos nigripes]
MSEDRSGRERKKRLQNACDECKQRKGKWYFRVTKSLPISTANSKLFLLAMAYGMAWQFDVIVEICRIITAGKLPRSFLALPTYCLAHSSLSHNLKKRGPKTGAVGMTAFQPVNVLVEQILNDTSFRPFTIPDSKESVHKILVKLAKRIRELERDRQLDSHDNSTSRLLNEIDVANPASSNDTASSESNGEETDGNVGDLSKELSKFSFGREHGTYFGESSNIMLMKVAMEHNKELHGSSGPDWNSIFSHVRRHEFWEIDPVSQAIFSSSNGEYNASVKEPSFLIGPPELNASVYNFPPANDLHRFIDISFTEWEMSAPLLHRPSFEKWICEGLHQCDSAFGAVVLAVCAHGANLLSRSRQKYPGDRWLRQIHLDSFVFKQDLELYHLQLYCLMVAYFYSTQKGVGNAWVLVGIAIRRAQEKGAYGSEHSGC